MLRKCNGFTLMEIMIVVIIMGVISLLAMKSYRSVMAESYKKNARVNVMRIDSALKAFLAQNPPSATATLAELNSPPYTTATTAEINSSLGINIVDANFNYTYSIIVFGVDVHASALATSPAFPYYCRSTATSHDPVSGHSIEF